jgi:hypothetical protein
VADTAARLSTKRKALKMKRLLYAVAVLVLCVSGAFAQVYSTMTLGTNAVPASSTNSTALGTAVDIGRQSKVVVWVSAKSLSNTNLNTFILSFAGSADGTTYLADNSMRVPLVLNGTNTATVASNLDASWYQYLRANLYESAAGNATNYVTNIAVKYLLK